MNRRRSRPRFPTRRNYGHGVKRQVLNPCFREPAFTVGQTRDEEPEALAHYAASLPAEGHVHGIFTFRHAIFIRFSPTGSIVTL